MVAAFTVSSAIAGADDSRPRVVPSPARVFLSWNAPHGDPRAREVLTVACGDTTKRDTLYLTFEVGRDSTPVIGLDAEIRLWPAPGDTLDRAWWFESRSNPAHLLADFNMSDVPGGSIWAAQGAGGVRTVSGRDTAFIRMVWAVRERDAVMLYGGRNYVFARLLVPRPRSPGVCARPLCFELNYARMATSVMNTEVIRSGGKWLSWNPGGTTPCAPRVQQGRVPVWRPRSR
jgi:hypothetical protein